MQIIEIIIIRLQKREPDDRWIGWLLGILGVLLLTIIYISFSPLYLFSMLMPVFLPGATLALSDEEMAAPATGWFWFACVAIVILSCVILMLFKDDLRKNFLATLIAAAGGGLVIGLWLMGASHSGFLGLLLGSLMFFPAFLFQISFVQWIFSLVVKRQLYSSLYSFVAYNMLASVGLVLAGLAAVSLFPEMDLLGFATNPETVSPLFYSMISTIMRLPGAVSVIVLILALGVAGYSVLNCRRLYDASR